MGVDETPTSVRAARAAYLRELLFRSGTPVFALLDALETLLMKGWGQSIGYFIGSRAEPAELLTHLRKFLFVDLPGKERRAYFRFYDPRVMRAYLPTCTPEQLDDWLREHLEWFVLEADEGAQAKVFVRTTPERRAAQGISDRLLLTPIQLPDVPAPQDKVTHAPDSRIAV